jgi:hypothetical protein
MRKKNATLAKNMTTERAASDQANQEVVRVLIPLLLLAPVGLPLLSRPHSTALLSPKRYEVGSSRTCEAREVAKKK